MADTENKRTPISYKELCKALIEGRGHYSIRLIHDVDIHDMELDNLDLTDFTFINVDLSGTVFNGVHLNQTTFVDCTMTGIHGNVADVTMNATGVRFMNCDLQSSAFTHINFHRASFVRSNLTNTRFFDCDLSKAYINDCNLKDTRFRECNFLEAAIGINYGTPSLLCPMACPDTGAFIGFKKAYDNHYGPKPIENGVVVVKLQIPERAKRGSATGRKCRASSAKVLGFYTLKGKKYTPKGKIVSIHSPNFEYSIGKTVRPTKPFVEDRWAECTSGIHFFITFEEAAAYNT